MDSHSLDSESWTRQCLLSRDYGAHIPEMALWVFSHTAVIADFGAESQPIPFSDVQDALGSDNVGWLGSENNDNLWS